MSEPLGTGRRTVHPCYLRDIWPSRPGDSGNDAARRPRRHVPGADADVFSGDSRWQSLDVPAGNRFEWEPDSTYIRNPPFFEDVRTLEPAPLTDIVSARALALLGDSITTDHISPAGSITKDSPAAST